MSKLRALRSQLASLRRWRQWFRWGTGSAGLLIALLWILAALFMLDFGFKLEAPQRAIVIVIGLAGLVWAAVRFAAPFFGVRESPIDMALLVERQQGIESDLVAALQFESPEASQWGSRELEDAVVDYVAKLDRELDVFEGFSRKQLWTRLCVLAGTGLLAAVLVVHPATRPYAHAFFVRLTLDNLHYPSATSIDRVLVNSDQVLDRAVHRTSPIAARSAQGQAVVFAAWASGKLPEKGVANVRPNGPGSARQVEMAKFRREEIEGAEKRLRRQLEPRDSDDAAAVVDLLPQERAELTALLAAVTRLDPARVSTAIDNPHEERAVLVSAARHLDRLLDGWPSGKDVQLYAGKLPRLSDKVSYKVELGDAWTDPAAIAMIELPIIEPNIEDIPPEYARAADARDESDPRSLQRSVIEGSQMRLAVGSSKPLQRATLTIITANGAEQARTVHPLQRLAGDVASHWPPPEPGQSSPAEVWQLNPVPAALARISGPLRFELQVIDSDGLSLETPLRGTIRLKADRPPRISGSLVHRAVLPSARPEVELRASDDYGIAAMRVQVSVVRGEFGARETAERSNEASFAIADLLELRGNRTPQQAAARKPHKLAYPLRGEALPVSGSYVLNLTSLGLARGDEVRITLSATDYRGRLPGVTSESEPIILEITDESGILAAVSEGDRRSQEQIDDLIRRQLGIGESP